MSIDILDARGRFWPADIKVPDGRIAPAESVTGDLRIRSNGRATLDLDGALPAMGGVDAIRRMLSQSEVEGAIRGYLFDGRRHIWLTCLGNNGGSLSSPIREGFIADRCLVSSEPFAMGAKPRFRWMDLPLDGYDEWLGRGNITVVSGRRRIIANYTRSTVRRWGSSSTMLELRRWLEGNAGEDISHVSWRERASLSIGYRRPELDIEQAIERASRIEDLLVLLADCNRGLGYFTLRASRKSRPIHLYYTRSGRSHDETAKWDRVWLPFGACSDQFGQVVDTWLEQYERHGPGFHLYLGNRRSHPMYPEHRFASLTWGLESLHRTLVEPLPNPAQAKKVRRILNQIGAKKDRDWASRHLPESSEPSLATRIYQLFSNLPIDLDSKQLEKFAQRCASRRNDISHYGGVREPGGYDAFLDDIVDLHRALDLLYHALLLQLAGAPARAIEWRFSGALYSTAARAILKRCGLEVAKVPAKPDRHPQDD